MSARFGSVVTAMVTPFDDKGALDLDAARDLARWLVANGNEGLVVTGTTGESPVLTDDEKLALWAAVAESVTVPVIAGAGSNDTAHSVHLTREASQLGVAGILAVCPYYNRPSQSGIDGHLRAIAAATPLPVVVYDIPVRTGRKITTATLLRLACEVGNVLALKDAAGNPGETAAVISNAPDGFEVYSGDDSMTLPLLAVGAVGVVGVATAWTGGDHQVVVLERTPVHQLQAVLLRMQPLGAYRNEVDALLLEIRRDGELDVVFSAVPQPAHSAGRGPDGLAARWSAISGG